MFGEDQCPIHYCKLEDYSYMTDCGEEWDARCPKCYEIDMANNIAFAEWYSRMLVSYGQTPLRMALGL